VSFVGVTGTIRVGFDARWYNDSGVGSYVAGLLDALSLRDDIDLVVYEHPKNPVPDLTSAVERIPLTADKYSIAGQFSIKKRCAQDGIQVFHSPFYVRPLLASCPAVVTIHDMIPFLFRINSWPKQVLVKMGYRIGARAEQIITVSRNTAADVQRILGVGPERITVVHNATDQSVFHARSDDAEIGFLEQEFGVHAPYVVVSSARNWATKNLPVALHALALAREQTGAQFQVVVYGPEDGLSNAQRQGAGAGLELRSIGYVSQVDLGKLFRHAQAFVMPSLYEGFGLPVLEAMSCSCAVITSNAGSLPEVAGDGAQIFAPSDAAGMSDALARLLCNPNELSLWRARALKHSADFSWNNAAKETVSVYYRAWQRAAV
jgi:glycosyltransferase involved in cell wall biosynthesis